MEKKQIEKTLGFDPIFWVLDTQTCRIMAVKSQDRYEMKGLFITYQLDGLSGEYTWMIRPACLNNQEIQYHPTSFEVTKDKEEAFRWAVDHKELPDSHPQREWADYTPAH